jgi:hypothetical protein
MVCGRGLNCRHLHTLGPIADGFPPRPARRPDAVIEFRKDILWNFDAEWANCLLHRRRLTGCVLVPVMSLSRAQCQVLTCTISVVPMREMLTGRGAGEMLAYQSGQE